MLLDNPIEKPRIIDSENSPFLIPFKNNDPSRPSCNTLVDFQKAISQRVIFDEQSPKLSEEQSLTLISELLSGKIIVIPGYADVQS